MYNHTPQNYTCPICIAISGTENKETWIKQNDIFYQDDLVTGFISSKSIEGNECHPLLVPNKHYENMYDMPMETGHRIYDTAKEVAIALKETRDCDGVNLVLNNGPAAGQHAFHYHLHIIPRFDGDNYNEVFWKSERSDPKDRIKYADALRKHLNK